MNRLKTAVDWYVLQAHTGKEQDIVSALRELGFEAFTPSRIMLELRGKTFKEVERLMLTGYIFVSLQMSVRAYTAIRNVSGVMCFLGATMPETVPPDEMERMLILGNGGEPWGISEGDADKVTKGPLKGREDWITKVDARRYRATVAITVLGECKTIELALRPNKQAAETPGDTSPVEEAADQTEDEPIAKPES